MSKVYVAKCDVCGKKFEAPTRYAVQVDLAKHMFVHRRPEDS